VTTQSCILPAHRLWGKPFGTPLALLSANTNRVIEKAFVRLSKIEEDSAMRLVDTKNYRCLPASITANRGYSCDY
jgi:hypothetical protein